MPGKVVEGYAPLTKKKPVPATPPQSTVLNGQTFLNTTPQPRNAWDPVQTDRGVQGGSIFGQDGSVWSPMQAPGNNVAADAADPRAYSAQAAVRPQGNPFDFWGQYNLAASRMPKIPARVPGIQNADRSAAENAAFARAKDRTALVTQGLLKSIRNNSARRGISGSPLALSGENDVMAQGAGALGEVVRDQTLEGLRREEHVADTNYSGDLSQRGQDVSAENSRQQMILSLLRSAFETGRY